MQVAEMTKKKLYERLAEELENRIEKGEFKSDGKLPAMRELAKEYSTTTVTVSNALKILEDSGFIERKEGSGIYLKKKVDSPFFPVDDLKKIFVSVLEDEGAKAFEYGDSSGFSGLKKVIAERIGIRLKNMEDREIIITSGSQQALSLLFSSMLKVGDWVLVEEPTYPAVLRILKEKGARIESVKMTADGPDIKELKRIFESRPLKMAYFMTRYQNPTGFCYSPETKSIVAKLASRNGIYVVEDNSYGELDFGGHEESPFKISPEFHIYLSSFSKTFLRGARIGCCICSRDIGSLLVKAKLDSDLASPLFFQMVLDRYITSGLYDKRLNEINILLKDMFLKAKFVLNKISTIYSLPEVRAEGGYSFWCEVPSSLRSKFRIAAEDAGLIVENGDSYVLYGKTDGFCVRYVRNVSVQS